MNLGLSIADPNVAEFFTVTRTVTSFVAGGTETTPMDIPLCGNVSAASARDINALPEGDFVSEALAFWCQQELFVTHADPQPGTSDVIAWQGERYRVMSVFRYPSRGYWKAICVRLAGD